MTPSQKRALKVSSVSLCLCSILVLFACAMLSAWFTAGPLPKRVFPCDGDPSLSTFGFCNMSWGVEARVADLVKRLTLQEKVGFLGNHAGSVDRLGIPKYQWWSEALHGVSFIGGGTSFSSLVPGATSFPQVILTAASFNATLFETIGKISEFTSCHSHSSFLRLSVFDFSMRNWVLDSRLHVVVVRTIPDDMVENARDFYLT